MDLAIPPEVGRILTALEEKGREAYVVGGCVRDSLLGQPPHDWDICTAATPQEVMEWDYNPATYQDSYDNPKEAYETLDDGIRELRDVLNIPEKADSIGKNERPIIKG